jgi:hypothetical protein
MPLTLVATGQKTVTSLDQPERLVSASRPCHGVLVMAPADANGAPTNSKPALLGVSSTNGANYIFLHHANLEGVYIPIDDAYDLYVDIGASLESVNYAIFEE